jgi:hypothetical protein
VRSSRLPWLLAALLGLAAGRSLAAQPRLAISAPRELADAAATLRAYPVSRLAGVVELVGLADPGAPVRVVLVPEAAPLARQTPRWISGFAVGAEGVVVLFPERVPSYPYDSLDALLAHEVAHVMLYRAAAGHPLPRWFQEGVALMAARDLRFADRERLLVGGVSGVPPSTAAVERAFAGEGYAVDTAYAIAGALAHELVRRHGRDAVARIAAEAAAGRPFPEAFAAATGEPLSGFEAAFWRRFRFLYRWVPFLTSGSALWLVVTGLAVLAIARRRARDAELRRRWAEEERAWEEAGPAGPS